MDIAVWVPGDTEDDLDEAAMLLERELPYEWYTDDFGPTVAAEDVGNMEADGFVADSHGLIEKHYFNPWTMTWSPTGWDGFVKTALERFGLEGGFVFIVPCK